MKKLFLLLAILVLLFASLAVASAGGRPLSADLSGSAEVAGGDPDGSGTVNLTLNSGQEEICFELNWNNIDSPTRAHIHHAAAGSTVPSS